MKMKRGPGNANPVGAGLPRCKTQGIRLEFDEGAVSADLDVPLGTPDTCPPLKRWASVECPSRDKTQDSPSGMTTSEAVALRGTEGFHSHVQLCSVRKESDKSRMDATRLATSVGGRHRPPAEENGMNSVLRRKSCSSEFNGLVIFPHRGSIARDNGFLAD